MIDIINQLHALVVSNRLPHAFILTGNNIDLIAESIALSKWHLCGNFSNMRACEICRVCQLLKANTLPDFMQIEPAISGNSKSIKLEQIRELIQFVQFKPQISAVKIALICSAEYLNMQAANALLKTLEEPPIGVHIILTTNNTKLLLETIVSRCSVYDISSLKQDAYLNKILLNSVLVDLYEILVLQTLDFITTINKWLQNEVNEVLTCLWLIVIQLIQSNFEINCSYVDLEQEIIVKFSQVQRLQSLWSILDKILAVKKEVLLGRQVNIQLFLENLLINWQQDINNARR